MKKELTVLDLFSGIGGFSLGLENAGFSTIAFCEIEPFCQKVLSKHWPKIPVAGDIRKLSYKNGKLYNAGRVIYEGKIDLICGGFPCQPFSVAGKQKGKDDNRHLWPEMLRVIKEAKPSWVIGENVPGIINLALDQVYIDLEGEDYEVETLIIPACAVGAPHRRDRVWIIAYNYCFRRSAGRNHKQKRQVLHNQNGDANKIESEWQGRQCWANQASEIATNDCFIGIQGDGAQSLCWQQAFSWVENVRRLEDYFNRSNIPKPLICGKSNGLPRRLDRLKALGNAVVPQIPEAIGHAIINSISIKNGL